MAIRVHRVIAFAAAVGDYNAAFRRASAFVSKNIVHATPSSVAFVNYGSYCPRTHMSHRCWSRVLMSTNSGEISEVPTSYDSDNEEDKSEILTYYDSDNEEDSSESERQTNDSIDNSQSVLLLKALTKAVQKALDNLSKKISSLQRELTKAQSLEETMSRANLILSNLYRLPLGTTSAEVEDWENDGQIVRLELNTKEYRSFQEESDALFSQAKKFKRGSNIVEDLMARSLEGQQILEDAILHLNSMADGETPIDEGTLAFVQERLERSSKKTGFKTPNLVEATETKQTSQGNRTNKRSSDTRNKPNPRQLTSPSGLRVLVGRNQRDNEAICFQLAKPTDVWMHSRGCPGAHVLLCIRRGGPEAKDEDFQFAANLAAFYSDARTETRAKISTADPKHITKPRGAPLGAVSLRKEGKTLIGSPGSVSDDLKEAREKSGSAWDELGYRKLGTRTKNKKKTASVEKAKKAKNREEAKGKNKRRKRKEEQDWF